MTGTTTTLTAAARLECRFIKNFVNYFRSDYPFDVVPFYGKDLNYRLALSGSIKIYECQTETLAAAAIQKTINVAIIEDRRELREGLAMLINGTDGFVCKGKFGIDGRRLAAR